jgi:hypothetical protein
MPDHSNNKQANALVLKTLIDHGDALTIPREVDHFAYFESREDRAKFIEGALLAGFKFRGTSEPDAYGMKYGAILWHIDIPDEDVITRVTELLIDLAESNAGEYDGWGTPVLR